MSETDDYTDEELYDYTITIMRNITQYYTKNNFHKEADIDRLIERGIAKKIANVMPKRYIEAEVSVLDLSDKKGVITSFSTEDGIKLIAMHEEVAGTDISHGKKTNREKIETLPVGKGIDELTDLEYFREKLCDGLKLPRNLIFGSIKPPTDYTYTSAAIKTPAVTEGSKPTIDFTKISQLIKPNPDGFSRYESGMHVGVDLAKVNVVEGEGDLMAKEISALIDKQILADVTKLASESLCTSAVPTSGWTEEKTVWDASWRTTYGQYPQFTSNPFGVITSNNAPVWCSPSQSAMEEISFSEAELDELIDLFNNCESEIMKFA